MKKACLASRNKVHLQKIILRCVGFCFCIFFYYLEYGRRRRRHGRRRRDYTPTSNTASHDNHANSLHGFPFLSYMSIAGPSGHSQLLRVRIKYHFIANLHITEARSILLLRLLTKYDKIIT